MSSRFLSRFSSLWGNRADSSNVSATEVTDGAADTSVAKYPNRSIVQTPNQQSAAGSLSMVDLSNLSNVTAATNRNPNDTLAEFFAKKGDEPLTEIEVEGVLSLINKTQQNPTQSRTQSQIFPNKTAIFDTSKRGMSGVGVESTSIIHGYNSTVGAANTSTVLRPSGVNVRIRTPSYRPKTRVARRPKTQRRIVEYGKKKRRKGYEGGVIDLTNLDAEEDDSASKPTATPAVSETSAPAIVPVPEKKISRTAESVMKVLNGEVQDQPKPVKPAVSPAVEPVVKPVVKPDVKHVVKPIAKSFTPEVKKAPADIDVPKTTAPVTKAPVTPAFTFKPTKPAPSVDSNHKPAFSFTPSVSRSAPKKTETVSSANTFSFTAPVPKTDGVAKVVSAPQRETITKFSFPDVTQTNSSLLDKVKTSTTIQAAAPASSFPPNAAQSPPEFSFSKPASVPAAAAASAKPPAFSFPKTAPVQPVAPAALATPQVSFKPAPATPQKEIIDRFTFPSAESNPDLLGRADGKLAALYDDVFTF